MNTEVDGVSGTTLGTEVTIGEKLITTGAGAIVTGGGIGGGVMVVPGTGELTHTVSEEDTW